MNKLKSYLQANSPNKTQKQMFAPYDQLPISLRFQRSQPFRQVCNETQYCLKRREKVRDFSNKTLEHEFKDAHELYQKKQNQLLKSFKIRCRLNQQKSRLITNEQFFMERLKQRQLQLLALNREYLQTVKIQIGKEPSVTDKEEQSKEEKIIKQYNIIYQYRNECLVNKLLNKEK